MGFSGSTNPAGSISAQTINSLLLSSANHEDSLRPRVCDRIDMKIVRPLKIHNKRRSFQCGTYKRGISVVYAHVKTPKSSDQWKKSSLYHVLGLPFGATSEEIKSSYRRLARFHHPDVAPPDGKDKSAQAFIDINSAYTTLSNTHTRADYDRWLITSMKVRDGGFNGGKFRGMSWETDQCW